MRIRLQGQWYGVLIDDHFVVTDAGKFAFATGGDPDELWVSLLEKAVAKCFGCYQNMAGHGTAVY